MIDPLRLTVEINQPVEISRPVFCGHCLTLKAMRNNPNVAVKVCDECKPSVVRGEMLDSQSNAAKRSSLYLCHQCDSLVHKIIVNKGHTRRMLLVGPSVTKSVISRGDEMSFPSLLDLVKVRLQCSVYNNGRRIHSEPPSVVYFNVGLSGRCVHVQVLGGVNLLPADADGSSDPFVVYNFCGKQICCTRVRPRSLFPRWDNETFIVPLDMFRLDDQQTDKDNSRHENSNNHRQSGNKGILKSQREVVKIEVFDHDWFSKNDFIGHIELNTTQLAALTSASNGKALLLPLSQKETHGTLRLRLGYRLPDYDDESLQKVGEQAEEAALFLEVLDAEDLDKVDTVTLSSPFANVFCSVEGEEKLLGSTPIAKETIHPDWAHIAKTEKKGEHIFRICSLRQFLLFEDTLREKRKHPSDFAPTNSVRINLASERREPNNREMEGGKNEMEVNPVMLELIGESDERSEGSAQRSHDLQLLQELQFTGAGQAPPTENILSSVIADRNGAENFLRIEVLSQKRLPPHWQLGQVSISVQQLRALLPELPFSLYEQRSLPSSPGNPGRPDIGMETNEIVEVSDVNKVNQEAKSSFERIQSQNVEASFGEVFQRYVLRVTETFQSILGFNARSHEGQMLSVDDDVELRELPNGLTGDNEGDKDAVASLESDKFFRWSGILPFSVLKLSSKSQSSKDRDCGSLIVRLLPASRGQVVTALDEGVRQMTLGEKSSFKCRFDSLYGNNFMGASIPPRANMILKVELCEINKKGLWAQERPVLQFLRRTRKRITKMIEKAWNYIRPMLENLMTRLSLQIKFLQLRERGESFDSEGSSEEYEDGEEEDYDEFNMEDSTALQIDKVRPDPRLRKHLTKAVKLGHKLMWGYEPKTKVMSKQRMETKRSIRPPSSHSQSSVKRMGTEIGERSDEDAIDDDDVNHEGNGEGDEIHET